jgi:hypothetical protein
MISKSAHQQQSNTHSAAHSSDQHASIIITIQNTPGYYAYQVAGPPNLAHGSAGHFETAGDRSLCEAATKALQSLKPGRTWRLRAELASKAHQRGNVGGKPRKLSVIVRTTSPTFAQLGMYLASHQRVETKGGRLVPSMRALHRQLQRFEVRWELVA